MQKHNLQYNKIITKRLNHEHLSTQIIYIHNMKLVYFVK